jgi:hypothetical protein
LILSINYFNNKSGGIKQLSHHGRPMLLTHPRLGLRLKGAKKFVLQNFKVFLVIENILIKLFDPSKFYSFASILELLDIFYNIFQTFFNIY